MFEKFLVQILTSAALKIACEFFGFCASQEDCDGEECRAVVADLELISQKINDPTLKVGKPVGGPLDFIKCLDFQRLIAWVREGIAIFNDARVCPDGMQLGAVGAPAVGFAEAPHGGTTPEAPATGATTAETPADDA